MDVRIRWRASWTLGLWVRWEVMACIGMVGIVTADGIFKHGMVLGVVGLRVRLR
jgi:hypothetical protein